MQGFFVYFLPDLPAASPDAIRQAGLAYAVNPERCQHRHVTAGPGDRPGVVIATDDVASEIGYFPDWQTWQKMRDAAAWIGFDDDALPGPDDLAAHDVLDHFNTPLGDGNRWRIPAVIDAAGEWCLPKVRQLADDGSVIKRPAKRYEALALHADHVRDAFRTREPMSDADEWAICLAALQVNYRIGPDELDILCKRADLLDDQSVMFILSALVDRHNWADVTETETNAIE